MEKVVSSFLLALLSTGIFAQTTWKADKSHSQVSFAITHLGISEVEGVFRQFDATIVTPTEQDFSDAWYEVEIEVASVYTGIERRDNHLRNEDFFHAEKFPKMIFKGATSEKISDGRYKVTGDLTLHGVTKPVTLDVWHRGTIENQRGETIAGFQITGSINRSDFNIGPGFTEPALSDDVRIKVDGEFKKQSQI